MLMRAATVVQVLRGLFYVLLQLLVEAAVILSFKFHCKLYCSCDPSIKPNRHRWCSKTWCSSAARPGSLCSVPLARFAACFNGT